VTVSTEPFDDASVGAEPSRLSQSTLQALPLGETCRMFETPFIEKFSRIHPATPFVFWLPVFGYFAYRTHQNHLNLFAALGTCCIGSYFITRAHASGRGGCISFCMGSTTTSPRTLIGLSCLSVRASRSDWFFIWSSTACSGLSSSIRSSSDLAWGISRTTVPITPFITVE
jgi:hypothetical protein